MAKPDDIAQDVWDAAEAVTGFVSNEFAAAILGNGPAVESEESLIRPAIARAIMAERERSANIATRANERYAADQEAAKKAKDRFKARDFESMRMAAGGIAAAIRGAA